MTQPQAVLTTSPAASMMTRTTAFRREAVAKRLVARVAVVGALLGQESAVGNARAIEGQAGYVRGELVFSSDDRPTPQCHASTIAETRAGTLTAAWFGGECEGSPDVGIWTSRHDDNRWTRPVEVATGEWTLGRRFPCWNPVLFQPVSGPLMLFFKVGPSPKTWWGELMYSDDDGRTWRDRRMLPGGGIGPVKNKPVQLADGAIICPSSSEHDNWRVHFEITRDLGQTWEVIGPIHDGSRFPSIQPSILLHPAGRMQILCRTTGKRVVSQSWSEDGGRTWSEMTVTSLPNPNSGTDAVTLRDGRHLIVYNPLSTGRHKLSVALSTDGIGWEEVVKLESEERGEYSYPAVIQTSDGLVHVTYTFGRWSIKHVVLDPGEFGR